MLRSLPGSTGYYDGDRVAFWHALKMEWDAVPTVYRWATYDGPSVDATTGLINFDAGDGDGTQDWDCLKVWDAGDFEQGQATLLAISDLWFGNANYSFSNMINARVNGSIKGVRFSVYEMDFDVDDFALATGFQGAWLMFDGEGDREEVSSQEVRVSLLPYKYPLSIKFPPEIFSPAYGFNKLPKPNATFPWGNGRAGAPPAPDNGGGNSPSESGGGGTPGNIGDTTRMPVVPVGRQRAAPRTVPPRVPTGGRNPRVITR